MIRISDDGYSKVALSLVQEHAIELLEERTTLKRDYHLYSIEGVIDKIIVERIHMDNDKVFDNL